MRRAGKRRERRGGRVEAAAIAKVPGPVEHLLARELLLRDGSAGQPCRGIVTHLRVGSARSDSRWTRMKGETGACVERCNRARGHALPLRGLPLQPCEMRDIVD